MPDYHARTGAPVWFDLMSSDADRAADFYGQLFGWTASEGTEEFGGYRNFSANGKVVAGLMPATGEAADGPGDAWTVYFKVDDANAAVEAAKEAGGQVFAPPMPVGDLGVMAILSDPAGAMYGLWQPGTHPGFTERGTHGTPYWFDEMSMNYPASTEFYTKSLGWHLDEIGTGGDPDAVGPDRYSQVTVGEGDTAEGVAGIMAATGLFGEGHPSFWQVYITVDDVPATAAKAAELGGTVLQPGEVTPFGTLGAIKDPMGAAICIATPPADR